MAKAWRGPLPAVGDSVMIAYPLILAMSRGDILHDSREGSPMRPPAGDSTANLDLLYQNTVRSYTLPASVGRQPFRVPASANLGPVHARSRPLPKGATTMH